MKISGITLALMGLTTACSSSSGPTASGGAGGTPSAGTGGTVAGATATGGAGGTTAAGTGGAATSGGSGGSGGAATCTKCPTTCCENGAECIDDGLGNLSCQKACTSNSQCPASTPCCQVLKDGSGSCAPFTADKVCRCTTGAECSSNACAPGQDAEGNPSGPYICVPNNGMPYNGCKGIGTSCGAGYCCFTDTKGNEFCATQCTNDSMCGAAACVTYSNANTTCSGHEPYQADHYDCLDWPPCNHHSFVHGMSPPDDGSRVDPRTPAITTRSFMA